mgnify:CR=1 FL=1
MKKAASKKQSRTDGLTLVGALQVVIAALFRETGIHGTSSEAPKVRRFIAAGEEADWDLYLFVSSIPLAHFYAGQASAFDAGSLWQEIAGTALTASAVPPTRWDYSETTGRVALWLYKQVSE